jgi:serine/threonine protein kinase/Tol biopolymer transport system component
MSLSPGSRLGPYEILAPLGAGGMGEVYSARDSRLNRTVAIKVLMGYAASDSERRKRLLREARTASALNHPNIVTIHDVVSEDGRDSIVMEYVEGRTLKETIGHKGLPLPQVLQYGIQIASALAAAHSAGIVHRDLKPGNIMVTKTGVKVLDFGLAKVVRRPPGRSESTESLTAEHVVVGTLAYMAPEQLNGEDCDARTDIFALGLVLYEMIAGKPVFSASKQEVLLSEGIRCQPPRLENAPPPVARAVERCLARDPDERWQSAKDVCATLELVEGLTFETQSSKAKKTRAWLGWKTITFLVAFTLGWGVWTMSRRPASDMQAIHLSLNPPSRMTFSDNGAVVSPDGRLIAFVAAGKGTQSLWVRHLQSPDARDLAGTDAAMYPFWSADSKSIGFFSNGKLKRVKAAGGAVDEICNAPNGRGGTWNAEGIIVFAPAAGTGLQKVSVSGGEPRVLTEMDPGRAETEHRWPQFLPDGKRFIFWVMSANPGQRGVYVSSLSAPKQRIRLVGTNFFAQYAPPWNGAPAQLLWVRGETLVAQRFDAAKLSIDGDAVPIAEGVGRINLGSAYFSVSNTGVLLYASGSLGKRQMEWWDRTGKILRIEGSAGVYYAPRISPDGSGIAIARVDPPNSDIWLYELGRRVMTRLTFDPGFNNYPVWSPDGKWLAFSASRSGPRNIYIRPSSSTGHEERLTQSPYPQFPSDWSREGRYLVYTEVRPATASDLWLLPMREKGGQPKPEALLVTPFDERDARFSPDGKWIVYTSNESGTYEVYVQPFPLSGKKWLISNRGGSQPVWRNDGRELLYLEADGRMMSVEVRAAIDGLKFSNPRELLQIPVRLGVPYYDYDVTADGQRFLVLAPAVGSIPEPLNVLVNWQTALRN